MLNSPPTRTLQEQGVHLDWLLVLKGSCSALHSLAFISNCCKSDIRPPPPRTFTEFYPVLKPLRLEAVGELFTVPSSTHSQILLFLLKNQYYQPPCFYPLSTAVAKTNFVIICNIISAFTIFGQIQI